MKKLLLPWFIPIFILAGFLFFIETVNGIEPTSQSYDVYANGGTVNYIPKIDNFNKKSSRLSFVVFENNSAYSGSARYTLIGSTSLPYGKKTKDYTFSLTIVMNEVKDCWNFDTDRIYCDGKGRLYLDYFDIVNKRIKKIYYRTDLETFRIDVIGGSSVNIAGGEIGNDIFRVTGMNVANFYSGKVSFPIEIYFSDNSDQLKYANSTINATVPFGNFVFVKNIDNSNKTADVYVCGEDFPGIFKFHIWGNNLENYQGTSKYMGVSNTFTMPICPNNFYIGDFKPGQKIQIPFEGSLKYTQTFSQGQLAFDVQPD